MSFLQILEWTGTALRYIWRQILTGRSTTFRRSQFGDGMFRWCRFGDEIIFGRTIRRSLIGDETFRRHTCTHHNNTQQTDTPTHKQIHLIHLPTHDDSQNNNRHLGWISIRFSPVIQCAYFLEYRRRMHIFINFGHWFSQSARKIYYCKNFSGVHTLLEFVLENSTISD